MQITRLLGLEKVDDTGEVLVEGPLRFHGQVCERNFELMRILVPARLRQRLTGSQRVGGLVKLE